MQASPMIFHSVTHETLFYLAHDKQIPDRIGDKECRLPKRAEGELCQHILHYMSKMGDDGIGLLHAGVLKNGIKSAGKISSTAEYYYVRLSHEDDPKVSFRIKKSKEPESGSGEPYTNGHMIGLVDYKRDIRRNRLKNFINNKVLMGDCSPIENTGTCTILNALKDKELLVTRRLIKSQAPEFQDRLEKLEADLGPENSWFINSRKTYKAATTPEPCRRLIHQPMSWNDQTRLMQFGVPSLLPIYAKDIDPVPAYVEDSDSVHSESSDSVQSEDSDSVHAEDSVSIHSENSISAYGR